MQEQASFSLTARALGALFYFAPDSDQAAPLVAAFRDGSWQEAWPLPAAWQRLFIGPDALPAPPWGSVWLDRESVLFGDSTLALRQWMREQAIDVASAQNEPEDHFGTLLLLAAWLVENGRQAECDQLLAWHLLPWSGRFLTLFQQLAAHPFYASLGQLAQATLNDWQSRLPIPVADKPLFR